MMNAFLKKTFEIIFTLWVILTLTFFLMRLLPGGPFDEDRKLPEATQQALNKQFKLDQPLLVQYGNYCLNILHGDFGPSYKYLSRSAVQVVGSAWWVSFRLGFLALLTGLITGSCAALWWFQTKHKLIKQSLSVLANVLLTTPGFLVGGIILLVFSFTLGWLPAARLTSPLHLILPVLALSCAPAATVFSVLSGSLVSINQLAFIKMKHASGLNQQSIVWHHIFRNAVLPLIALGGPLSANLLTGSFAIEVLFGLPGLGKIFVSSMINRDYTVVLAVTLIYSVVLLVANLLSDIALSACDPRLKDKEA